MPGDEGKLDPTMNALFDQYLAERCPYQKGLPRDGD
jgi:hypothetical protein